MLNKRTTLSLNQKGVLNPLVIPLVIAVVILFGTSVTAFLYYSKFIEQRDNNQPLIEDAVTAAEEKQKTELEAQFVEREKQPTKSYTSPSELGSVTLNYPKTWSSYVDRNGTTLNYYGHPNYVPSSGVNYALRMTITTKAFATELKTYDNDVKKGDLKASAVTASGVTGTRLDGLLEKDKQGSMVLFPLRDKVLKIWTESNDFRSDFDNIIVKNLTFVP